MAPTTIMLHRMNSHDEGTMNRALEHLRRFVPAEHDAVFQKVIAITVSRACGADAIACTWGPLPPRWIAFTEPPSQQDPVEVAVTLAHEARHIRRDRWGRWLSVKHDCVDCTDPFERLLDPIYRRDRFVRAQIQDGLMRARVAQRYVESMGWSPRS